MKLVRKTNLLLTIVVICSIFFLSYSDVDSATIAISPIAQSLGITVGAHIVPVAEYGNEINSFSTLTGKTIGVVMYFTDWAGNNNKSAAFDDYLPKEIEKQIPDAANNLVIMLTWQPLNAKKVLGCDRDYSSVPLDALAAGNCDGYIRAFADGIAARPERYIIRFAHEMNITDYPWWPGHTGEDASAYVKAFQHVHDVFMAEISLKGNDNVEWMWSPNYASNPAVAWNAIDNYYPGDRYVDWIGLSGYNWNRGGVPWMTFDQLYSSVLEDFACKYAKPVIIAEIGSVDGSGGSQTKSTWISEAYQSMQDQPFLRGVVWFNDYAYDRTDQPDFRITTSTHLYGSVEPLPLNIGSWTTSYKNAISPPVYNSKLLTASAATPPMTYCASSGLKFKISPSTIFLERNQSMSVSLVGVNYDEAQKVIATPPVAGIKVSYSPSEFLPAPWGTISIKISVDSKTENGDYSVLFTVAGQTLTLRVIVMDRVFHQYLPATNN